jgi:hypothetical protein
MMRPCRSSLSVLLALLVAVTAVHVGAMRGHAKAAGSIVLCTGAGPVSIAVDAEGAPVGYGHVCPDCVMSVLAAVDAPDVAADRVGSARCVSFGAMPVTRVSAAVAHPRVRGPPSLS